MTDKEAYSLELDRRMHAGEKITLEEVLPLAEEGYPVAQNLAGTLYKFLPEVRDYEKAAYWFLQAARQGHAKAQNNIGSMMETGTGVAMDLDQALIWYQKSAENGDKKGEANYQRLKELRG